MTDQLQTIRTFQQTTAKKVDGKHAANCTRSSDDRNTGRHARIIRKVLPYVKRYKLWMKTWPTSGRKLVNRTAFPDKQPCGNSAQSSKTCRYPDDGTVAPDE